MILQIILELLFQNKPLLAAFPIAAVIMGVASIVSSLISKSGTSSNNEDQKQFALQQYGMQRSDSLADWNMQNEYNSPAAQMGRLKAAGINPMYAAGNLNTSSPAVRSSDFGSYNPHPADISAGVRGLGEAAAGGVMDYYDIQQKKAVTNNLEAQNTVILQDYLLKKAQTIATTNSGEKTSIDTSLALQSLMQNQRLLDTQFEAQQQNLYNSKVQTQISIDENERRAASNTQSLQEGLERILSIRASREGTRAGTTKTQAETEETRQRIQNLLKDEQLKQLDINLKRAGVQPSDALWQRILAQLLKGISPGKIIDKLPEGLKNLRIN